MAHGQQDYSDEYVANVLKKDAEASSIKYSAVGLQAFLPKRPTGAAPKPNTRFLKNILRETDSHNAALLAKEQREARARQRTLDVGTSSGLSREERSSKKRRSDGDDRDRFGRGRLERYAEQDITTDSRRNRHESRRSRSPKGQPRKYRDRSSGSRSQSPAPRHMKIDREHRDERRGERREKRRGEHRDERRGGRTDSREEKYRHGRRDKLTQHRARPERSRSHTGDRDRRHARRSSRSHDRSNHYDDRKSHTRSRSASSSTARSRSPQDRHSNKASKRHRSISPSRPTPAKRDSSKAHKQSFNSLPKSSTASESDPLEAIVGPPPPPPVPRVVKRGRGAFASASTMHTHFAESYDPKTDVHPGSDIEDDWDQALEAMRDRQKWKQQGAERLRSAGFSDTQVKKWEKGDEKDETDVVWAKRGEGREWDRGKVVGEDGQVDLKPEWGRLKGT